jgi:hypothetical protein
MSTNRISATLSDEDFKVITDAFNLIESKLSFLIDLTAVERKRMMRLGDKSWSFVEKCIELARQNPGFLPRDFDIDEMARDFDLFKKLTAIMTRHTQIAEKIEDTSIAAGSEALSDAFDVYGYANAGGKASAGLKDAARNIGRRFDRGPRSEPEEPIQSK